MDQFLPQNGICFVSGSFAGTRSSRIRRLASMSRLTRGSPFLSIHALDRIHVDSHWHSEPLCRYFITTSERPFQQFTRTHKVCCLPLLDLRLTARLKLATRCSPTSFRTGVLPTYPVKFKLMLLPIITSKFDLRCRFIACWRFLTSPTQAHQAEASPTGR